MSKCRSGLSVLFFILFLTAYYRAEATSLQKTYMNDRYIQSGRKMIQTTDGGYAIVGLAERIVTPREYRSILFFSKYNSIGELEWKKNLSYPGNHAVASPKDLIQTSEGGFAIVAHHGFLTSDGREGVWVIKLDARGGLEWEKKYREGTTPLFSGGHSIIEVAGEDALMLSGSRSLAARANDFRMLVMKIKKVNGLVIWEKKYPLPSYPRPYGSIVRTADNNYAVSAAYWDSWTTERGFTVLKINPNGDRIWQKSFSDTQYKGCDPESMIENSDHGFTLVGGTNNDYRPASCVITLDADGNSNWASVYDAPSDDDAANSIVQDPNDKAGNYYFTGRSQSGVLLTKINRMGGLVWQKRIGSRASSSMTVVSSPDGLSLAGTIAGPYSSTFPWLGDLTLIKTDSSGDIQKGTVCGLFRMVPSVEGLSVNMSNLQGDAEATTSIIEDATPSISNDKDREISCR